jgi:hypothetical protein
MFRFVFLCWLGTLCLYSAVLLSVLLVCFALLSLWIWVIRMAIWCWEMLSAWMVGIFWLM